MGFQAVLVAFIADLLAANRKLLEDIRFKLQSNPNGSVSKPDRTGQGAWREGR